MWTCDQCAAEHEDQFHACWNCGATRLGESPAEPPPEQTPEPGPAAPHESDWSQFRPKFTLAGLLGAQALAGIAIAIYAIGGSPALIAAFS